MKLFQSKYFHTISIIITFFLSTWLGIWELDRLGTWPGDRQACTPEQGSKKVCMLEEMGMKAWDKQAGMLALDRQAYCKLEVDKMEKDKMEMDKLVDMRVCRLVCIQDIWLLLRT